MLQKNDMLHIKNFMFGNSNLFYDKMKKTLEEAYCFVNLMPFLF